MSLLARSVSTNFRLESRALGFALVSRWQNLTVARPDLSCGLVPHRLQYPSGSLNINKSKKFQSLLLLKGEGLHYFKELKKKPSRNSNAYLHHYS